jgi:gluconolactonase
MQIIRRYFLGSVGSIAAVAAGRPALAEWESSQRYPDPLVRILDPSFAPLQQRNAKVEQIATGMRWCEGPVWFGDGRYLLWSDIPNNRIMRWDEETGAVSVFRKPSNHANGNTRDRQGRLLTCEHGRRVTRTEYDGSVSVIADAFEEKRSIHQMTSSASPTAQSGSPIRRSASLATTKASAPSRGYRQTFTAGIRRLSNWP